jgi:DNA-directed RNA polymerase subunit RPC12/RpoP
MEIAMVTVAVLLLLAVRWFFRARNYAARGIAAATTTFINEEVDRRVKQELAVRSLRPERTGTPAGMVHEYSGRCVSCEEGTNGRTVCDNLGNILTCEECYREGKLLEWMDKHAAVFSISNEAEGRDEIRYVCSKCRAETDADYKHSDPSDQLPECSGCGRQLVWKKE